MADLFDILDAPTAAAEGGYTDNPLDSGGPTMHGITQLVARQNGYSGAMQDLTADQAKAIRRSIYYARPGIYLIAPVSAKIATKVYDAGVNMGTGTAVMFLQRMLNVLTDGPPLAMDGAIGPATAARLTAYLSHRPGGDGTDVMLKGLNGLQATHYVEIAEAHPNDRSFVYGWLRARVSIPA